MLHAQSLSIISFPCQYHATQRASLFSSNWCTVVELCIHFSCIGAKITWPVIEFAPEDQPYDVGLCVLYSMHSSYMKMFYPHIDMQGGQGQECTGWWVGRCFSLHNSTSRRTNHVFWDMSPKNQKVLSFLASWANWFSEFTEREQIQRHQLLARLARRMLNLMNTLFSGEVPMNQVTFLRSTYLLGAANFRISAWVTGRDE